MEHLAEEFVAKKLLPRPFNAVLIRGAGDIVSMSVDHPAALARVIAFAKSRAARFDAEILIRGQDEDHPGMRPSLFRVKDPEKCKARTEAYHELVGRAADVLGYERFRRDNLGAVLQHYGIRTPWLDLVDNLYTAIWFALHTNHPNGGQRPYYTASAFPHGWIYLVATRLKTGDELEWLDLRKHHSSMNVRLHAQHGLAAASQADGQRIRVRDYAHHVVARIRIPRNRHFAVEGPLARPRFLFPDQSIDETLQILLESSLGALLDKIERDYGLAHTEMGRVAEYRYRRPKMLAAARNDDA